MSTSGYVYVLSNPSMPGMVKIGRSINGGEERAKAIYATGVPTPFKLEFELFCAQHEDLEMLVHDRLTECRVNPYREFFRIDPQVCAAEIMGCYLSEYSSSGMLVSPANDAATIVDLRYLAHLCEVSEDELFDAVSFIPKAAVLEGIQRYAELRAKTKTRNEFEA